MPRNKKTARITPGIYIYRGKLGCSPGKALDSVYELLDLKSGMLVGAVASQIQHIELRQVGANTPLFCDRPSGRVS